MPSTATQRLAGVDSIKLFVTARFQTRSISKGGSELPQQAGHPRDGTGLQRSLRIRLCVYVQEKAINDAKGRRTTNDGS